MALTTLFSQFSEGATASTALCVAGAGGMKIQAETVQPSCSMACLLLLVLGFVLGVLVARLGNEVCFRPLTATVEAQTTEVGLRLATRLRQPIGARYQQRCQHFRGIAYRDSVMQVAAGWVHVECPYGPVAVDLQLLD